MLTRGATLQNLHTPPRRRAVWLLWGVAIVLAFGALAARMMNFQQLSAEFSGTEWLAEIVWWNVLVPLAGPAFATVGAFIVARHRENAVGWLALLLGGMIAVQDIVWQYAMRTLVLEPGSLPFGTLAGWLANLTAPPMIVLFFSLIFLLFPTGHTASPRWRVAFSVTAGTLVTHTVSGMFASRIGLTVDAREPNPLALGLLTPVADFLHGIIQFVTPLLLLLAIASIFMRWRGARGIERQQLKWIAYLGALLGISLILGIGAGILTGYSYVTVVPFTIAIAAITLGVPVAIGAAILRYRLFDIDVVINRTLVYGALSLVIGAGYASAVLGLQFLFGQFLGGQDLAIVLATLAAVAAVRPVRDRIQRWADRRFYRRKYDTSITLARLSESVREEVDLERLQVGISGIIDETMQPRQISIWLSDSLLVRSEHGRASDGR
jgi:hypothetical protein